MSVSVRLLGSGIVVTATSYGAFSPEIRAWFTVAPAVVYSPIVPVPASATNRFEPETAMPFGKLNPENLRLSR